MIRKSQALWTVLLLLICIVGISACGGATDDDGGATGGNDTGGVTDPTDESDNGTTNDGANAPDGEEEQNEDSALIQQGEEVVQKNCIGCHGSDLQGGAGPSLIGLGDRYSTEELIDIITNGRGTMPGGQAEGNEEAVVAYLLTLK